MNPFALSNLTPVLAGRRILLGVGGSIAAFKTCDVVRFLRKCGAEVQVILTESGSRFVTPVTLETLSGRPVRMGLFGETAGQGTHHIDLARWADVFVVAPATANRLAKMAAGIADDLLTTEYLAFKGPVLVAPAMNPVMFSHPATQRNLELLKADGVQLAGPDAGLMACGEEGDGRMVEPETLVESIARCLYAPSKGKRALVSLGPTRSALDPVRYLTNRSSGKMGAAMAWALRASGYDVTVVRGAVSWSAESGMLPADARVIDAPTAARMAEACEAEWPSHDLYVGAAAVLDWEFANTTGQKLKKGEDTPGFETKETRDILKAIGHAKKPGQFVLGFAAETKDLLPYARRKLETKRCDAVFANDVSRPEQGFDADDNGGWWVSQDGELELPRAPKSRLAYQILALVEGRMPAVKEPVFVAESASHRSSEPGPGPTLQA